MENLEKEIETKFKLLEFTTGKFTVQGSNLDGLERQKTMIKAKVTEIHNLKVRVIEKRIGNGDDFGEIEPWSQEIEECVLAYELAMLELDKAIRCVENEEKEKEEAAAAKAREKRFEEELLLEKKKWEQKLQFESKIEGTERAVTAKLPRLVISPFSRMPTDWIRFWGEFEAEIDLSKIPHISKFSYLKELLAPSVRSLVDGLPFTTEGYERAKNILKQRYGKTSVIVNAHVSNIISLPFINGSNPYKINEFYEKLLQSIQALETLGKIREVNGYTRMTLDKLPGIRSDLVRLDDDWEEWDFPTLTQALQSWTQRNPPREQKDEEKPPMSLRPKLTKSKAFQAKQQSPNLSQKLCVYCDSSEHRSVDCSKITSSSDRKRLLSDKHLCFNCTSRDHRASQCTSQSVCKTCKARHHTSICDKKPPRRAQRSLCRCMIKIVA